MKIFLYVQVLFLLAVFLIAAGSPVPTEDSSQHAVVVMEEKPDFPVADILEEDKSIKTHVIGKMDDLEATTWVSSLSELNFTFPPDMAKSLELEDVSEAPEN